MKIGKTAQGQISWEYFLWWQIISFTRKDRQPFLMGTPRGCEQT